jgi:hypothetical protein
MDRSDLNRRDFTKLTMAALGGALAGAGAVHAAAQEDGTKEKKSKTKDPKKPLLLQEPHICRGLNACKNKGKGGKNACAGQGNCPPRRPTPAPAITSAVAWAAVARPRAKMPARARANVRSRSAIKPGRGRANGLRPPPKRPKSR